MDAHRFSRIKKGLLLAAIALTFGIFQNCSNYQAAKWTAEPTASLSTSQAPPSSTPISQTPSIPFTFLQTDYGVGYATGASLLISNAKYGFGEVSYSTKTAKSDGGLTLIPFAEWDYTYYGIPPGATIGDGTIRDNRDCYGNYPGCYTSGPTTPLEGWQRLNSYLTDHVPTIGTGQLLSSVPGAYWFQHYSATLGPQIIGAENGAGTGNFQSHLAFSRGAAAQFGNEWLMDYSSWYGTSMRESRTNGNGCPTCGHSDSLARRLYYLSWLGGANYLHDEGGSLSYFLDQPADTNGVLALSPSGVVANEFATFTAANSRGVPFVPIAVVLNRYHGIGRLWSNGLVWDYIPFSDGDRSTYDLFNQILWPAGFNVTTYSPSESQDMVNTPFGFGDGIDVLTEDASPEVLSHYKILLLTGDLAIPQSFMTEMCNFMSQGGSLILNLNLSYLEPQWVGCGGRIYAPGDLPSMANAIAAAYSGVAPVTVTGNISYQLTRTNTNTWLVALYNNSGVSKPISSSVPETIDHQYDQTATIAVGSTLSLSSAQTLRGPAPQVSSNQISVLVPAGDVTVVRLQLTDGG